MRGRARILDSRYLEFMEYLQKLGELQSITRMISSMQNCVYGQHRGACIMDGPNESKEIFDPLKREGGDDDQACAVRGAEDRRAEDRRIERRGFDPGRSIFLFWQRGWIEIQEIEKKRKEGSGREYVVKMQLQKIADYYSYAN